MHGERCCLHLSSTIDYQINSSIYSILKIHRSILMAHLMAEHFHLIHLMYHIFESFTSCWMLLKTETLWMPGFSMHRSRTEKNIHFTLAFQIITDRIKIKYFKYPETHKVLAVFELSKSQLFDKPSKQIDYPFYWADRKFLEAMSMIPFFPSLRPTVGSSICIDADSPCDEESELREIEKEHVAWVSKSNAFSSSFVMY